MPRRKKVQDSGDGWSTVTSGPSPRPTGVDPLNTLRARKYVVEPPSKSYEQVLASYNKYREILRGSEEWKTVLDFVETTLLPQVVENGGMNKCVCLGLGSLEAGMEERSKNSHYQLVLLEALIEAFGWRHSCMEQTSS